MVNKMSDIDEKSQGINKKDLFNHIKESCVADPLYVTKMIISALGKNMFEIVSRMVIYVVIVYPLLTQVLNIPAGAAMLLVVAGIIAYHSSMAVYHKIVKEAKENGNVVKKNEGGLT